MTGIGWDRILVVDGCTGTRSHGRRNQNALNSLSLRNGDGAARSECLWKDHAFWPQIAHWSLVYELQGRHKLPTKIL